jgi:hypothetical protein
MENIYIVFIEYDKTAAKISPIKCSFKNIIKNSIKSLNKNIYYYNQGIQKITSNEDLLVEIIRKNDELNRNISSASLPTIPTISFIIINSNDKTTPYYVINCDIDSIGRLKTPINKNITNLISNLKLNINYNNKKENIQPQPQPLQLQLQQQGLLSTSTRTQEGQRHGQQDEQFVRLHVIPLPQ